MSATASVLTILASACVVLAGLVTLTRAIWKAAQDLRDNKQATQANTVALDELKTMMDGRIVSLESRMTAVEGRLAPGALREGHRLLGRLVIERRQLENPAQQPHQPGPHQLFASRASRSSSSQRSSYRVRLCSPPSRRRHARQTR